MTKEEKEEQGKIRDKAYREANKEKIRKYNKAYRTANKERIRAKKKARHIKNREKFNAHSKAYRAANKEVLEKRRKRYYAANKEKVKAYNRALYARNLERHKDGNLKRIHGITLADYKQMFEAQGGRCKICRKKPGKRMLAVDHCHETLKIRGLLCGRCNTALGSFGDSINLLLKAAAYLEENG